MSRAAVGKPSQQPKPVAPPAPQANALTKPMEAPVEAPKVECKDTPVIGLYVYAWRHELSSTTKLVPVPAVVRQRRVLPGMTTQWMLSQWGQSLMFAAVMSDEPRDGCFTRMKKFEGYPDTGEPY